MSLCTLAQVKTHLTIATLDTDHDAVLNQLIGQVSARLAREAGRIAAGAPCLEKTSLIHYYFSPSSREHILQLPAYPVVSISEIKEAMYGAHADATALVENESYQVRSDIGHLIRIGFWLSGINTVKVTYIGGYTAAGETPGDGETALPDDIVEAAVIQTAFWHKRRLEHGVTSAGFQGGQYTGYAKDELLPEVKQIMRSYRTMGA